jgi:WD40 repeat protein
MVRLAIPRTMQHFPRVKSLRYAAFLSYARVDKAVAARLQGWLEQFRIPEKIARAGAPIGKIFRDETDFVANANLSKHIESMLDESAALVVLASPSAAQSEWVNKEITYFRTHYETVRPTFALIAGGTPHAPANSRDECFPLALKVKVERGKLTSKPHEPLAPNIQGEGEDAAFLRLAAGLLNVSFDALYDRHKAREEEVRKVRARQFARAYTIPAREALDDGKPVLALKYALAHALEANNPDWDMADELAVQARHALPRIPKIDVRVASGNCGQKVAISPDDRFIYTYPVGFRRSRIRCWNLAASERLSRHDVGTIEAFATGANTILYTEEEAPNRLVSLAAGSLCKLNSKQLNAPYESISQTIDDIFVACRHDGLLDVITLNGKFSIKRINIGVSRISAIACASGTQRIAFGTSDGGVGISRDGFGEGRAFVAHNEKIRAVAASNDGKTIVSGASDGSVRVWDETGTNRFTLRTNERFIEAVNLSSDGRYAVSCGSIYPPDLWDTRFGKRFVTFDDFFSSPRMRPTNVDISSDGTLVVVGASDGRFGIYDFSGREQQVYIADLRSAVNSTAWSPQGDVIAINSMEGTELRCASSGRLLRTTLEGHSVKCVAFSPDGMFLLCGIEHDAVKVNVETGKVVTRFHGHTDDVTSASFSKDAKRIVTGSHDNTARIWSAQTGALEATLEGHEDIVSAVRFAPDGAFVATSSFDTIVRLFSAKTGSEVRRFIGHKTYVSDVDFSPDGKLILSSSGDGDQFYLDNTARLWDVSSGLEVRRFSGHDGYLTCAQFSPDGSMIATGSFDKAVRIWDSNTGILLLELKGHEYDVNDVRFSPDGSRLLSGGGGMVLEGSAFAIWNIRACRLVGRRLTAEIVRTLRDGLGTLEGGDSNDILLRDVLGATDPKDFAAAALNRWPDLANTTPY